MNLVRAARRQPHADTGSVAEGCAAFGGWAGTNRRRTPEIPPCAVAWLRPLAALPGASLYLKESHYRALLNAAATTAGITWEENLLRHSYGTYRLALCKNAATVAEEMGNSVAIVRTHYANVTSPEQATAWWTIAPAAPAIFNWRRSRRAPWSRSALALPDCP